MFTSPFTSLYIMPIWFAAIKVDRNLKWCLKPSMANEIICNIRLKSHPFWFYLIFSNLISVEFLDFILIPQFWFVQVFSISIWPYFSLRLMFYFLTANYCFHHNYRFRFEYAVNRWNHFWYALFGCHVVLSHIGYSVMLLRILAVALSIRQKQVNKAALLTI